MLLEPSPVTADARGRRPAGTPAQGVSDLAQDLTDHLSDDAARDLTTEQAERAPKAPLTRRIADVAGSASPRAGLAVAGLAAAGVGAVGVEAGLLWAVAGVWTVRAVSGGPVGVAWGLAVVGAGLRWGTTSLQDIEVATRITGPTVAAGPSIVRVAMIIALAAAIAGEAQIDGLRARTWAPTAASLAAVAFLPPAFLVAGPVRATDVATVWWGLSAAAAAAVTLVSPRFVRRIPSWAPAVVAAAAIAVAVAGS